MDIGLAPTPSNCLEREDILKSPFESKRHIIWNFDSQICIALFPTCAQLEGDRAGMDSFWRNMFAPFLNVDFNMLQGQRNGSTTVEKKNRFQTW